jgi:hypothetical protein
VVSSRISGADLRLRPPKPLPRRCSAAVPAAVRRASPPAALDRATSRDTFTGLLHKLPRHNLVADFTDGERHDPVDALVGSRHLSGDRHQGLNSEERNLGRVLAHSLAERLLQPEVADWRSGRALTHAGGASHARFDAVAPGILGLVKGSISRVQQFLDVGGSLAGGDS